MSACGCGYSPKTGKKTKSCRRHAGLTKPVSRTVGKAARKAAKKGGR